MPVPFGFSVGDFVGGIELLLDGIKSLRDTNGARDDYRELIRELTHLKIGLKSVEALYIDSTQAIQCLAAKAMVDDCLMRIDDFIQQNARFSSLDSTPARRRTVAGLKDRWRMVQWALWKKTDVVRFKSQVQQHVEAIQMLLASIQINQLSAQGKLQSALMQQSADHKNLMDGIGKDVIEQGIERRRFKRTLDDQHKLVNNTRTDVYSLIKQQRSFGNLMTAENRKTRDQILHSERESNRTTTQLQNDVQHTSSQVEVLLALERSIAGGETQYQRDLFHEALQNETRCQTIISNQDTLIQNQKEMLATLRDIASMARVSQAIPAQVLLSTPVVLLDARGRCAPFHLEFIDCSEAFVAVLKVRFKDIGLRKIEKGQFALEDTTRKRSLRLSDAWSTIVRPGQHISMSMVFRLQELPDGSCPSCGRDNEESDKAEVECANIACRLTYRRIVDNPSSGDVQKEGDGERSSLVQSASAFNTLGKSQWAGSQEDTLDDEIKQYTRVQIVTLENEQSPPQQQESSNTSSYWSVCEQNDFYYLLLYFGTDWHAIARSMKTKTHIMIKNFYNRKIQEGAFGKYVEEEGARADKLRAEGVKAQASRGDAVLIGFMGGLNHPDLATKVGEVPLPQSDNSDVDDLIDVEGREQIQENKRARDRNVNFMRVLEDRYNAFKKAHSRPARPKILTRPSLLESKTGFHVKLERQSSPSTNSRSSKRAEHGSGIGRPLSRSSYSKGDTDSAAISPMLRRFTIPDSERSPIETLPLPESETGAPTPIGEMRRNVSGISRESQPPKSQPVKSQSYSEQEAAAISSQMQAQSRESLLNRITIPLKEKAVIGPHLGTFPPDERFRAMFISRDMVKEKEQRDMEVRKQLHEAKEREAKEKEQRDLEVRQQLHEAKEREAKDERAGHAHASATRI